MKLQMLSGVGLLLLGLALLISGWLIGLLLLIAGFFLLILLNLHVNGSVPAAEQMYSHPLDEPVGSHTVWHSSTHEGCSDQNRSDTDSSSGGDSGGGCAGD